MWKASLFAIALALYSPFAGAKELYWIVNLHAIDLIRAQGPEASSLATRFFDNERTYVTLKKDENFSRLPPHAVPTVTFTSYEDLARALEGGKLDSRFKAVLYDAENWKFTPEKEKLSPAVYHEKAASLVHRHGLKLLATPAANLAKAIHPGSDGDRYGEYLRLNLAASAARHADVFEIQAQGSQPAPPSSRSS